MKSNAIVLEIITYCRLIVKKWVFLLALALDVVGVIVQYIFPIKIPPSGYGIIAVLGLLIANFEIYRENQRSYHATLSEYERRIETIAPTSISFPKLPEDPRPQIVISLIEGSEYSFTLLDATHERTYSSNENLPDFHYSMNIKIENSGNTDLQIIGISSDLGHAISFATYPLVSRREEFVNDKGEKLTFPIILSVKKSIYIHLKSIITLGPTDSELLFAASLRESLSSKNLNKSVTISVEGFLPSDDSIHKFEERFSISVKHLRDLLFFFWERINRDDLSQLAKTNN